MDKKTKATGVEITPEETATYFKHCAGGCRAVALILTGDYYRKVINLMSGWKNNTPMFV